MGPPKTFSGYESFIYLLTELELVVGQGGYPMASRHGRRSDDAVWSEWWQSCGRSSHEPSMSRSAQTDAFRSGLGAALMYRIMSKQTS